MIQTKISFDEEHISFLNTYEKLGFKDKSSLVRTAIDEYIKSVRRDELARSAKMYAKLYQEDSEMQELTESALEEWPE